MKRLKTKPERCSPKARLFLKTQRRKGAEGAEEEGRTGNHSGHLDPSSSAPSASLRLCVFKKKPAHPHCIGPAQGFAPASVSSFGFRLWPLVSGPCRAFVLLEAMIAVAMFSIGVLALGK